MSINLPTWDGKLKIKKFTSNLSSSKNPSLFGQERIARVMVRTMYNTKTKQQFSMSWIEVSIYLNRTFHIAILIMVGASCSQLLKDSTVSQSIIRGSKSLKSQFSD